MSRQSLELKEQQSYGPIIGNRWVQLALAVLAMVMIASVQYTWTLFSTPLSQSLKVSLSTIQYAFTICQLIWCISQPSGGIVVDKFGTRLMFTLSSLLVGFGWVMMGRVHSVAALYFFYAIAGIGAGIIYGGAIGAAVKWFPDKRGLASGIIAAGFGAGALPFIPVIGSIIKGSGVSIAFFVTGIIQGVALLIIAQLLRYPPNYDIEKKNASVEAQKKVNSNKYGFSPSEMLLTPHFWLIWIMFIAINLGGLLLTANAQPFAKNIGIAPAFILLGVSAQNVANGTSRIAWGWVSDRIGRYQTMAVAFILNAFVLFLLPILGRSNVMYVVMVALAIFTWGELYALFPSVNADMFGTAYATTNYGLLYSAKGIASIFGGGLGAYLAMSLGWNAVFSIAAATSLFAGVMSIVLPKIPKPVQRSLRTQNKESHIA